MRRWCSIIGCVLAMTVLAISVTTNSRTAHAQISIDITIAPPELPDYDQPPLPGAWLYLDFRLLGVGPGWLLLGARHLGMPPTVGLLWTPGYRAGTTASTPGMRAIGARMSASTAASITASATAATAMPADAGTTACSPTIGRPTISAASTSPISTNQTVIVNNNVTRVSFNGGSGGTTAQPTAQQQAAAHEHHTPADHGANPASANREHQPGAVGQRKSRQAGDRGNRQAEPVQRQGRRRRA